MTQQLEMFGAGPEVSEPAVKLRPYQEEAINSFYNLVQKGENRFLLQMATGLGKTVVFSEYERRLGRIGLFLAHRDELIQQAVAKLRAIWPEVDVGVVKAERNERGHQVTVASVQTLSRERRFNMAFPDQAAIDQVGLVVSDECFPAGTLIDGKPIETIKAGDMVTAFDEATGTFAMKRVVRRYKRKVGKYLVLTAAGGRLIVSTQNHPFYTKRGWVQARSIINNEVLLYAPNTGSLLQMPENRFDHYKKEDRQLQTVWQDLLLGRMQAFAIIDGEFAAHVANQSKVRLGQNDNKQPYVEAVGQGKGKFDPPSDELEAYVQGREWTRFNETTSLIVDGTGSELDYRVYSENRRTEIERMAFALPLQAGSGRAAILDSGRGGRPFSPEFGAAGTGREENGFSSWARLDGFALLEQGSDGTFGGLCEDGYVYNFEVEDFHTYIANGFVVHNCHHSFANTYKSIYSRFNLMERAKTRCIHLGVTATPKRGDGKAIDDVYDEIAYSMGIRDGILGGYLSDLTGYTLTFQNSDMADVKLSHGEYDQEQLEKAINKVARNEEIVECWQEKAKLEDGNYRQTILFGITVDHAEKLTQAFSKAGIRADLIHGELPDDKRAAVLHRYATGKTTVVCNVGVLTEGYDNPATSCIIMARPTRSQALYIQCIGRGTRLYPGKRNCLILDVADVSGKMSVIAPVTLSGALGLGATDGKPTKEVPSVIKQLKMKLRAEGLGPGVEEADAEGGKDFDPFADPFAGQDGVNFRWATGKSGLTIPLPQKLPDARHYLVIQRRDDWLFDVVHVKQERITNGGGYPQWKTTGEKFVNTHGLPDEAWAAGEAEKYAKRVSPHVDRLAGKEAQWRSGPASESQVNLLLSKGLMPNRPITKGQASSIMDGYFASKIKVNLKRETSQLEFV